MQIPDVKIRRGIFQGDSLSPLLFCIAIDPLSKIIKNENIGYSLSKSRKKADKAQELISHLLFMDDLKLYAADEKGLEKLIRKVHAFSRDIGMEFGLDIIIIIIIIIFIIIIIIIITIIIIVIIIINNVDLAAIF